jgi:hypothetical protein
MKICPVAIAVGCAKCPVFTVCPAKAFIGDYVPPSPGAVKPAMLDDPPEAKPR